MGLRTIPLVMALLASSAMAIPYPVNNPKAMVQKQQTATGEHYSLDIRYLDKMVADIAVHAGNYPVQFDSAADRTRAVADLIRPLLQSREARQLLPTCSVSWVLRSRAASAVWVVCSRMGCPAWVVCWVTHSLVSAASSQAAVAEVE